jgi:hypothetical protein
MCVSAGGISCITSCILVTTNCAACGGSAYTGCTAKVGSNCNVTYDNNNKLYCGVLYTGMPSGNGGTTCQAGDCATKTTSVCGLEPNMVSGDPCR